MGTVTEAQGDERRQPLLHDLTVVLAAPTQAWSAADGQVLPVGAQGVYHGDLRVLSTAELLVDGRRAEHVATVPRDAGDVTFVALARWLGTDGPDPTVRVERHRLVRPGRVLESVLLRSTADEPVRAVLRLQVGCDLATMDRVRAGGHGATRAPLVAADHLRWDGDGVAVALAAPGADVDAGGLTWHVELGPREQREVGWGLTVHDTGAVVTAPSRPEPEWSVPTLVADDSRLAPLLQRALQDLAALRMVVAERPDDTFLAAGAPCFFTLFGRDSLWAARLLLPLGTDLAASTLRVLAALQGRQVDATSAEEPGKILHELRRGGLELPGDATSGGLRLPPLYYGTVDATPLWVCLLHDAWQWGLDPVVVEPLLDPAEAALGWLARASAAYDDGFLRYVDESGAGLANQGWKDSGDAVQWRDGRLAAPPIALSEVQGYAHEAAVSGAALLQAFGRPGADRWLECADGLRERFRGRFWVEDAEGPYPAVALDADGGAVDCVASNMGHLLGTGLLDGCETRLVAERLTGPDMDSGYGLRTLSRASARFGPLSYHGGAVWPHDTAIVLAGMVRAGCGEKARPLVEGLLAAGTAFDGRLPELFGGDARADLARPVPYPAACRPQAWAAASVVAVLSAALGLRPEAPQHRLVLDPMHPSPVGAMSVGGLRVGRSRVDVEVDRSGTVVAARSTVPDLGLAWIAQSVSGHRPGAVPAAPVAHR